jgi:regulator of protease activity HflC (stomatin/prohibitin superfamily)
MRPVLILAVAVAMAGCHSITTEPGNETVIIDNPWFFGHGGVRDETQKPGLSWYWFSTRGVSVVMTPLKYDEPLDHLATADNNFINYNSYIVLQWKDPG